MTVKADKPDETSAEAQLELGISLCSARAVARGDRAAAARGGARSVAGRRALPARRGVQRDRSAAEALESYEAAARLQPDHWRALKGIGVVLDRLGKPVEATAAYQRAREVQRR